MYTWFMCVCTSACVCVHAEALCLCTMCVTGTHGDQKRALDFLELELWIVVGNGN